MTIVTRNVEYKKCTQLCNKNISSTNAVRGTDLNAIGVMNILHLTKCLKIMARHPKLSRLYPNKTGKNQFQDCCKN